MDKNNSYQRKVLFLSNTANFSKFNLPYMRWFKEQGWQVENRRLESQVLVEVDPVYVKRLFDNLFSNIEKYADPGRPVSIEQKLEGDCIRVSLHNFVPHNPNPVESTNIGLKTCESGAAAHGGRFTGREEDGVFTAELILPLDEALEAALVCISIGSQGLSALMEQIAARGVKGKTFVLCMKGIEQGSGKRLSEIALEYLPKSGVAVWIGPGHVQEFVAGIPNCMVIDGTSEELKERLVTQFSSSLIRFYYGRDLIGNEVGAAAKNVIGIAAGILDGMGLTNLKGALMARGTREVARLIVAMGGIEHSAYGLCHLGDYQATVFSQFSHNRAFGEAFARGEKFGKLAEGYYTVEALMELSKKYGVDMPISRAVHAVLYNGANPRDELTALFMRSLKKEF